MSIQILGTGAYVPERVLTNDELSTMVETSDEWITQRVGVKERRISTCESAAEMGAKAAQRALEAAGITADQLDLIVGATVSSDTGCPSMSALVQEQIGAHCPAFDVNSACSGFLFALDTAAAFIARGGVQYALVLGAERLSRILDWTDRSTCVIFGDGSGAFVIGKGENYLGSHLHTQGGDSVLSIPLGKGNSPFYEKDVEPLAVHMSGQETFKFAVKQIVGDIKLICGIHNDGSIEAVKTLSHSETSGIGSKVVDNASGYRDNYAGKTAENYQDVDAVTGATISSKAYKAAIASAFEAYKTVKEAQQ